MVKSQSLSEPAPMTGSQVLNQLLNKLNQEGGFAISVLTDNHGLALASASNGLDPDVHSAVVAQVQKTTSQFSMQLGMAQAEEIVLNDTNGQRLVCRPFTVQRKGDSPGQEQVDELILAVMVPGKDQTYRRATNQAISEIHRIWKIYWK